MRSRLRKKRAQIKTLKVLYLSFCLGFRIVTHPQGLEQAEESRGKEIKLIMHYF